MTRPTFTPEQIEWLRDRLCEFDPSDDYHRDDTHEPHYYAGISRAIALIEGRIDSWSDLRLPSRSVTEAGETYGAVTGGNGRSPLPCPTCGLPTWDGLHATGYRACYMGEVPGV